MTYLALVASCALGMACGFVFAMVLIGVCSWRT